MLTFVVVGGGPTSVEFTSELYDFLEHDVSKYYKVRILAVTYAISYDMIFSLTALFPFFVHKLEVCLLLTFFHHSV